MVLFYNQNNTSTSTASAAEQKPLTCRKQTEVGLPLGRSANIGPNEAEIPIGQVIDKTESLAERTMDNLLLIIDNAEAERVAAMEMKILSGQCSAGNCTTPGCYEKKYDCEPHDCNPHNPHDCGTIPPEICYDYDTCYNTCTKCIKPSCGGDACPAGIANKKDIVNNKADAVKNAYETIRGMLYDWRPIKPIGNWWIPGCPAQFPANPLCWTEGIYILQELERSRSGDYQDWTGSWVRSPAGLKDCVIRPSDQEAFVKGEKSGKLLLSCQEALSAGLLNSDTCYGMTACTAAKEKSGTILENCPRAENYYCCE